MRSFTTAAWAAVVLATGLKVEGLVLQAPTPTITPGPSITGVESLVERDDPDAISLAQILLTALPASLRIIAATNVPAVSSILWTEFLDDKRPEWFNQLPLDIQSYLIRNFGPSTAWPTATTTVSGFSSVETTEASIVQTSELSSGDSSTDPISSTTVSGQPTIDPSVTYTSSTATTSLPSSTSNASTGLSRNQKVGIGLGVPLALLGATAILLLCCFLIRRRRRKSINGSQPPSSPGFIPRFAFQEKGEHHTPLNRESSLRHFSQDTTYSNAFNWDDDVIEPVANTQAWSDGKANSHSVPIADLVAAPSLYHTHSSNRARGTRTSYSSLHSVAEVYEPDESPVLPRESFRPNAHRRLSSGLIPGAAQTKRKPIPFPDTTSNISPLSSTNGFDERTNLTAPAAVATLLRPSIPSNSNSDSTQSNTSVPSSISPAPFIHSSPNIPTSPVSPLSSTSPAHTNPFGSPVPVNSIVNDPPPRNPFLNDYYVEDYGPEYTHVFPYDDLENGLYGGHTDLSRYPEYNQVMHPRVSSKDIPKTEWPLRNTLGGHRRNKSPLWDRIYDG